MIAPRLPDFTDAHLLVIGDALLDCYVIGDVGRISPEAPVPVVRHLQSREVAGGAANVAMNVAALGSRTTLVTVVGDDAEAGKLLEIVGRGGIAVRAVADQGRPTSVKTRIVGNNQQLVRIDRESVAPLVPEIEERLIAELEAALAECSALLISDYGKGTLTDRVLAETIRLARQHGVPCIVDPKRKDFTAYAGADLIKPNMAEFEAAVGRACPSNQALAEAAVALAEDLGSRLLVTRSSKGMSLFSQHGTELHVAAQAQEVFDVSGAGDTVLATLGCALASDWPLDQAVTLANIAAGLVVRKAGTATLTCQELISALGRDRDSAKPEHGLVVGWDEARRLRQQWQQEGYKVGFTNGCFDLLHPGHVRILAGAAAHCDRLIVGLNSDASITRLKGSNRPVQAEHDRAEVLAALADVALVVLFEQDTPEELVRLLVPDVIAKGADYREDQVVGGDVVKAAGGRVVLVPLLEGRSTSRLVERSRS